MRIFLNRETCLRLVTALCVEVSDPKNPGLEWVSGKEVPGHELVV